MILPDLTVDWPPISATDSGIPISKIRPVGPHILVEMDKPITVTQSGLLLPEAHQNPPGTATVVKVGRARKIVLNCPDMQNFNRIPISTEDVKVGDKVAYRHFDGVLREIECEGRKLKFLRLDEILSILLPDELQIVQ